MFNKIKKIILVMMFVCMAAITTSKAVEIIGLAPDTEVDRYSADADTLKIYKATNANEAKEQWKLYGADLNPALFLDCSPEIKDSVVYPLILANQRTSFLNDQEYKIKHKIIFKKITNDTRRKQLIEALNQNKEDILLLHPTKLSYKQIFAPSILPILGIATTLYFTFRKNTSHKKLILTACSLITLALAAYGIYKSSNVLRKYRASQNKNENCWSQILSNMDGTPAGTAQKGIVELSETSLIYACKGEGLSAISTAGTSDI